MLPPDPYTIWPWAGSHSTSVTFSRYVPRIRHTDALNAILVASRVAAIAIYVGNGDKPIDRNLNYVFGSVTLNFYPRPNLTWKTWNLALSAFTAIFDYEYAGFSFTVNFGPSPVGTGFLRGAAIATPQATPQAA